MDILTVEGAFDQFRRLVEAQGFDVRHEKSPTSSTTSLVVGSAQLRLVWAGKEELLFLQISQGPPDRPQLAWLELFRSKLAGDSFREADLPEINFVSSVEYGLELMTPRKSS
ncbi:MULTISPECIES: hypothetical protein [Stenotrophomonas]|uniref:hypothetical protein n=1 Tax=Stenotrophomonas TaxID=40323 RepID=UPI000871E445|nr:MULTISPECIES: hypothetical protein [Stenotrophomonas]OEY99798.1 hypothetical protein BIY45_14840 [Stenotrophomonas sp. BIIR7]